MDPDTLRDLPPALHPGSPQSDDEELLLGDEGADEGANMGDKRGGLGGEAEQKEGNDRLFRTSFRKSVDSDSEPEAVSPEPPPVASPPVSSPLRAPPQSEPMALLETAELVEAGFGWRGPDAIDAGFCGTEKDSNRGCMTTASPARLVHRVAAVVVVLLVAFLAWSERCWSEPGSRRDVVAWATERLRRAIPSIQHLEIEDVSDGHTNQGFFDGSGRSRHPEGKELKVLIVSDSFESLSSIDRQRLVHVALKEGLRSNIIHALPSLQTLTTEQWEKESSSKRSVGCTALKSVQFEDLDHNVVDLEPLEV
ncbi:BolA-like protein DDB_G0274169 [Durusdinium trenchii]|uniref:BolA-like protein DDB_G0274169 n=1 Tax=Durusdinium trenchii TaxID=1381693 RepID=A0ABP0J3J9_9DINO